MRDIYLLKHKCCSWGVAIEHIGAMLQKRDGNFHDQLSAILNQLLPLLSSEADRQLWIGRVVASYNGIKHFFRAKNVQIH